jgi:hypothetical protein
LARTRHLFPWAGRVKQIHDGDPSSADGTFVSNLIEIAVATLLTPMSMTV